MPEPPSQFHYCFEAYLVIGIFMAAKYGKVPKHRHGITTFGAALTGFLWPIAITVMWLTGSDT